MTDSAGERFASIRLRSVAGVCGVAIVWVAPIAARLWRTPDSWWIARDDGVITLSHARNLVEHGTIGVSPGDRVEGYSSPLHLVVAAAIDVVTDLDATALSIAVLVVGLGIAGPAIGYGVTARCSSIGLAGARWSATAGLLAGGITAVAWTTTGWIGSGMENPLIVAGGALVAGAALAGLTTTPAKVVATVGIVSFAISRVEFAALVAPVAAALLFASFDGDRRPTRLDVVLVVAAVLGVGLVHVTRRVYFGAWLPNTAIVQQRGAGGAQLLVIASVALFTIGWMVRASGRGAPWRSLGVGLVAIGAVGALWLDATGRTGAALGTFLEVPGVLPLAAATWLVLGVRAALGGGTVGRHHWVLWTLAAVPLGQVVIVGPARLDDFRVAAVGVVFLSLSFVVATAELIADGRHGRLAPPRRALTRRIHTTAITGAAVAVAVVVATVGTWRSDHVRALSFEVGWADSVLAVVEQVQREQFGGEGLVVTANPDLGKVSFEKRSVMVDLGWLGDPLLATLRVDRPDLVDSYLGRVAVPDVVSSHSGWSCEYRGWLESDAFVFEYRIVDDPRASWTRPPETCPLDGRLAIWWRIGGDDVADENAMVSTIMDAEDPARAVRAAIDRCRTGAGDDLRCQPVRRAVQRAATVLRDRGVFDAVVDEFDRSPSAAFDRAALRRDAGWWRPAAAEITVLLDGSS